MKPLGKTPIRDHEYIKENGYKFENVSSGIELNICVKINGEHETFTRSNRAKWYHKALSGDSSVVTKREIIEYLNREAKRLAKQI